MEDGKDNGDNDRVLDLTEKLQEKDLDDAFQSLTKDRMHVMNTLQPAITEIIEQFIEDNLNLSLTQNGIEDIENSAMVDHIERLVACQYVLYTAALNYINHDELDDQEMLIIECLDTIAEDMRLENEDSNNNNSTLQ